MLVAKNLEKVYRVKEKKGFFSKKIKEIEAVKNIDITLEPGQIVGLLGANGAGKTTTIKMLTTLLEPSKGSISIDGIDAVKYPRRAKEEINIITGGERSLYWRLTAKENLEYFGSLYNIPKKKLTEKICNILKIVGLDDTAEIPVEKYSKGMKQRLQIARGLINDPKYLFLDEPTLGLDVIIAKEMRSYIKKLATEEEKGILLTTHYITEAEELCDYIYIIHKGEMVSKGSLKEIKELYSKHYEFIFQLKYANENIINKIKKELSVGDNHIIYDDSSLKLTLISSENNLAYYIQIILISGAEILGVQTREPNLEDILIDLLSERR